MPETHYVSSGQALGRAETVQSIHQFVVDMIEDLETEHHNTPMSLFGGPRRRHHEIMGASRILAKLSDRITAQGTSYLKDYDASRRKFG